MRDRHSYRLLNASGVQRFWDSYCHRYFGVLLDVFSMFRNGIVNYDVDDYNSVLISNSLHDFAGY
jgi:hypothetical protein